jgi:hypothetical protein
MFWLRKEIVPLSQKGLAYRMFFEALSVEGFLFLQEEIEFKEESMEASSFPFVFHQVHQSFRYVF